jgi:hypothetical protein
MKYSSMNFHLSPSTTFPVPGEGITTFSVQMATSGVANPFKHFGLQIAQVIPTYVSSSGMSVFGANVQRTNLESMSLLTTNIPGGIMTYIECSAMPQQNVTQSRSHTQTSQTLR